MKIVSNKLSPGLQLAGIFVGTLLLMTAYEFLKELLFRGALTPWQSHLMTILVTAICATVVSYFIRNSVAQALSLSLQQSTARFDTLLNSAAEGVYGVDMQGECTFINPSGLHLLGYSDATELLGQHMHAHIHHTRADGSPYPVEECRLSLSLQSRAGIHVDDEVFWRRDGSSFHVDYWSRPVWQDGEVKGAVITFLDISERSQAEAELRIAATAFESHESMMITDADCVILRVNKAFTETTGYTSEEAVGQKPSILKSGRHNANFYHAMWEDIQRDGAWQGEIWDRRKNGEVYPKWLSITAVKGEGGEITHYVGSHIDITERKHAEEKIKYLAFYDPLTHLPNRRLLMDRLQHALAFSAGSGRGAALMFIDLDNFKALNDTLGHDMGDLLLQQVAQRLGSCVREGDTVARLGGDEFVVLLEDMSDQPLDAAEQAEVFGEKILAALNQSYQLEIQEHYSTPSIGVTLISGHRQTIEELLKQADIAMYQAKKAGRNTIRFFDPQTQIAVNAHVAFERELRLAIERKQFHLYYQIQVDSSGRPVGAEALIRWIHPERGMVSPLQFIPLAEETGLILPIGLWVLDTACSQLSAWRHDANARDLVLAVNVSARQIRQADFVAQVQAAVQRHAIDATRLKLELTETLLLENIEEIIATMNALKAIGVQFSLDDFGTGYSSLQYLKRLPLNQLKIDQSFVRDLATDSSDKAIVRTIIAMAHSLSMEVIAEGVETEQQRQFLLDNGCLHYQGYLFGKPVPVAQFETQLGSCVLI
ncbi:MAG: EAL domain-containing protein [Gallionella sp.]